MSGGIGQEAGVAAGFVAGHLGIRDSGAQSLVTATPLYRSQVYHGLLRIRAGSQRRDGGGIKLSAYGEKLRDQRGDAGAHPSRVR
ncbi:hypothetical protein GCM10009848_09590 [Micromonospora lupini]